MSRETYVGADGFKYCKKCGEKAEMEIDFPLLVGDGTEKRKVSVQCRCQREEKEAIERRFDYEEKQRKINQLRRMSLIDNKLKDARLSNYIVTEDNRKVLHIVKKYIDCFDDMYKNSQGLIFYGEKGLGKSYAAAVIANEMIDRQRLVVMTSFVKLLENVGGFNDGDYLERLNTADLLILDDLGVERSTDTAIERVYNIVDSRYRTGKPTIFTTNLDLKYIMNCEDIRYARIYDRICEMCYPVKVVGKSWRKKDAATRFEEMKKLLEV